MNNEPVAWLARNQLAKKYIPISLEEKEKFLPHVLQLYDEWIPLYTHQAKELNAGGEPVKNATYWKRQYNEMSALNDRLKSSLYHANEQIKYLESHPAKTLTDEEIIEVFESPFYPNTTGKINDEVIAFARAILRKAQEK